MTDNHNTAASQPKDEDWTPEQIDELAGVVRDKCGPATAQRLRRIIERAQSPAASQPSERHATLRYERGTPGNENDMPSVVSCNWLPDGDYAVYLATPQPPAASQPSRNVADEQFEATFKACGGQWTGDQWVIEDADFHPMIRAVLATLQPPAASQPSNAVCLRSLLARYVAAEEEFLGTLECRKSKLYREAVKALDAAVQGKK